MHILKSRKFWAAIVALVTIGASLAAGELPARDAVFSVVAIVLGYIGATAWEDAAGKAVWKVIESATTYSDNTTGKPWTEEQIAEYNKS